MDAHHKVEKVAGERGASSQEYLETLAAGPLAGFDRETFNRCLGDIYRTGLDPLSNELLFLKKGGKVTATEMYAGTTKRMRRDGITQVDVVYETLEDGDIACKAILGRVREDGHIETFSRTEYLSECQQQTGPWKQYPRKMLGHRAIMQTARLACSVNLPSAEEYLEAGFEKPNGGEGLRILGGAD